MSAASPDISVIMPVYGGHVPWIRALLGDIASSLRSSLSHEILLVDDASPEPLAGRLGPLPETARILRLDPNGGVLAARNAGIAAARGRYIQFVDADDRLAPDLHARLYEAIAEAPDVVTFRTETVHADGHSELRGRPDTDHRLDDPLEILRSYHGYRYLFSTCNKLYRRDLALRAARQLPDVRLDYVEDHLFNALFFRRVRTLIHREIVGYHYRVHDGQSTDPGNELRRQRFVFCQEFVLRTLLADAQSADGELREELLRRARSQYVAGMKNFFTAELGLEDAGAAARSAPDPDNGIELAKPWMVALLQKDAQLQAARAKANWLQTRLDAAEARVQKLRARRQKDR